MSADNNQVAIVKPQIVVEKFKKSGDVRVYHVTWNLSQCVSDGVLFPAPIIEDDYRETKKNGGSSLGILDKIGQIGTSTLIAVSRARGIEALFIGRYTLVVYKARAFQWRQIEDEILKAILEPIKICVERDRLEREYQGNGKIPPRNSYKALENVKPRYYLSNREIPHYNDLSKSL